MRTSWTNDSVTIISIPKNRAPNFNGPILWPSTDNQTFFAFGGELSNWAGLTGPDVSCWQFTIDGNGGGSWPIFQPGVQSTFRDLTRPAVATGTTLDNTGFIFRGSASIRSAPQNRQIQDGVYTPIPGIVSFNNTSTLWQNDTVPQYIEDLNAPQGMLATADTFGTRVARAIVGLMQYLRCNDVYAYRKIRGLASDVYNPPPFNNVTIYDPSDKTWHAQTATVQIPAARSKPCTVGVPGDNGTYEMFVSSLSCDFTLAERLAFTDSCMVVATSTDLTATSLSPSIKNFSLSTKSTYCRYPHSDGSRQTTLLSIPASATPAMWLGTGKCYQLVAKIRRINITTPSPPTLSCRVLAYSISPPCDGATDTTQTPSHTKVLRS